MKLSEHFTLAELTVTQQRMDNTPSHQATDNLIRLCKMILEPARAWLGNKPIIVTSGYRSPEVNRAVGGTMHSQHLIGQAADFIVPGMTPLAVCQSLKKSDIPYHQLIFENFNTGWTHISWSGAPARRSFELPNGQPIPEEN